MIEHIAAGDKSEVPFRQGDILLTHSGSPISRMTQLAQRIRFRGADHKYTFWSHAAVIVSADGDIVEAVGAGVLRRNLDHYANKQRTIVPIKASAEDRAQVAAFAERYVGSRYGLLTNVSIWVSYLTGTTLTFGISGEMMCGGLVARALERADVHFAQEPSHVMPADLAKMYRVDPPTGQAKRIASPSQR